MDLFKIIREGTKAVPATKYAVGISALVAVIGLVASIKIDFRIALWGVIILICLMAFLLLFARLTQLDRDKVQLPSKILMWFFTVLFIFICICLTSSVFFKVPVDLQYILTEKKIESFSIQNKNDTVKPASSKDSLILNKPHDSSENNQEIKSEDISVRILKIEQALPLVGLNPKWDNHTVFCEALKTHLLISHNQANDHPIRIWGIQFECKKISSLESDKITYLINADSLVGHGIVNINEYLINIEEDKINGRYIFNREKAYPVDPENIFKSVQAVQAFSLEPNNGDAFLQLLVSIQLNVKALYKCRFKISYDTSKLSKTKHTSWIYIASN